MDSGNTETIAPIGCIGIIGIAGFRVFVLVNAIFLKTLLA
jgi:hypothetical protein